MRSPLERRKVLNTEAVITAREQAIIRGEERVNFICTAIDRSYKVADYPRVDFNDDIYFLDDRKLYHEERVL
ncbi:hypothetical protein E2562_014293 [Oryza meyeriana var. granulata]|uniref:Uncharacterized protein n=1 Tax=Oryza meyeriana var. granulata TaxID=110450 RepID=A0A6G1C7A0_9ORYZ|nr:hypothetical protein E2562_014293 [Oryza meyeriana var. granulata]